MQKAREHFVANKKTPCFEPLKTFYASFDGKVYPCCFKGGDADPLGNLKSDFGLDIWNSKDFAEIREKTLENKYRADICATCLRSNSYPHHHSAPGRFALYSKWFSESFDIKFDKKVASHVMELPDNDGILERRKKSMLLKRALTEAGLDSPSIDADSDIDTLRSKNTRQFAAAMKAFHPKAEAVTRRELARIKILSFLPTPGKKKTAGVLLAAITLGIANTWVGSSSLALVELGVIFAVVALVVCRRLLKDDKNTRSFTVDRFLDLLSQTTR